MRAFVFLLIAIGLMLADHRLPDFYQARSRVTSLIAYPFTWIVDMPVRLSRWVDSSITTERHLLEENAKLRAQALLLTSRLQQLITLKKENNQLRLLLQSTAQVSGRVEVARLLAINMDPSLLQVIINKGTRDQVYVGQSVLDAYGVLGQVIANGLLTSKVLLITDPRSAVPVKDVRSGFRGVAQGTGLSGHLVLIDLPEKADIQVGDTFVASGLGLRFPAGYPVGTVARIKMDPLTQKPQIVLMPAAHLDRAEQVLLSWPAHAGVASAVQKQLEETLPKLTNHLK